ncbi:MAG: CHAT domain-containing protein, partial [Nocardioides sp.]|uniref:CHAT domain-containing protein n=1 Tax=Nocardioides sp. TaxID=35761 RepID=UPI003F1103F9
SGRMGLRLVVESRLAARDLDGARSALTELGRRRRQDLSAELHERFLRAAVADAEGDGAACGREVRAAAGVLQQRQGTTPSLEVRAGLSVHGARLADLDVGRALRSGRPQDVYASAERWRASAHRTLPVTPDPDPEIAETISQLRQLRLESSREEGDGSEAVRAVELEERLRQLTWARGGRGSSGARPSSYGEVRDRLTSSGQSLLMYVAHHDRRFALVIGPRGAAVRPLPAADLDALADRLRRDLRARSLSRGTALAPMLDKAVAASALALDAAAVEPVIDLLGDDVVVAPSRRLASCAWGLLPSLAPRALTVAPSVTRWAGAESVSARPEVTVVTGPGVPGATGEAKEVAAAWEGAAGTVQVAEGATSQDLVEAFAGPGVVHVAAHGTHEDQNPLFSSLRMSDGPAYVHELGSVASGHAVLSACDVGQSQVSAGDEPLGLTAALLALGVGSVVASVSPLPDEVAAEAMAGYHRLLAGGESAARALARTRAAVPGAEVLCLYGADWSAG